MAQGSDLAYLYRAVCYFPRPCDMEAAALSIAAYATSAEGALLLGLHR